MTPKTNPTDSRWQAVLAKDKSHDGEFVYAVKTTGIFCRPSCPSRPAKRPNVLFFETTTEAAAAGFRACKRCKPEGLSLEQTHHDLIRRLCAEMQREAAPLSLDALAAKADMSPWHLHRLFKSVTGVTPREYQQSLRTARMTDALGRSPNVTAAIYEAGFNSSGRFYEEAEASLGMKPTTWRKGGKGEEIRHTVEPCALGMVLVAATRRGVCAIEFGDSAEALIDRLHQRFPHARFLGLDANLRQWVVTLLNHLEHPQSLLDLPLDIQGTVFQQKVWKALRQIPPGETRSYTAVATEIGQPKAVRAVASACASNTLAVAIPCHRVVRTNGDLSGYRWGIERKAQLLRREKPA